MLLTVGNTKTLKGEKLGYMTFILHLAPYKLSGHNVCPKASDGCIEVCLNTAGRGRMTPIQLARLNKTKKFFANREKFLADLHHDVLACIRKAERENFRPVFRLNGTSDLAWERYAYTYQGIRYENIMTAFPQVQWYDYTKRLDRKNLPENYHLTFSRSEINDLDCYVALKEKGQNVAVVFPANKPLPSVFMGRSVINGDESDLRFLDPKNVIVGLIAKGKAKKDCSGFVVNA